LIAGDQGMSYLTLRSKSDAGLVKLSTPNVREQLKPTKRRHRVSSHVVLSIPPVLAHIEAPVVQTVMEEKEGDDGMTVKVIRLGADKETPAPATSNTGGYFIIVMNGSINHAGELYEPWSLLWVGHEETPPILKAATLGAEIMIAIFPRRDEWMNALGEA